MLNKCINSVVYYTFIVKLTVHRLPEGRNCSCAGRSGAQSSVASALLLSLDEFSSWRVGRVPVI